MSQAVPTSVQKARRINLDASKYGTFAEIGAGQEIARWFFHAGGAAGSVAKTISAYDMAVSDAAYGPTRRYVSRERLLQMLDHEYALLEERLTGKRGGRTTFFVIADTVATRSHTRAQDGSAWLGIRFQHKPQAAASQILLHAHLRDIDNVRQQEAMGDLGVNLVYGAFFLHHRPHALIESLLDNLSVERVEIDMLEMTGDAFAGVDNHLIALHLVRRGFTQCTVFAQNGSVVQPNEILHGKPLLILRGRFRPVTNTVMDMVHQAGEADLFSGDEPPVELFELSMHDLQARRPGRPEDFLIRVDMLRALRKTVLLSRSAHYHLLPPFLRRFTGNRIVFLLGLPNLREILNSRYYHDLPGGLLEGMGRLFMGDVRLAVYPEWDGRLRGYVTATDFHPPEECEPLYRQLCKDGKIVPLAPRRHQGSAPLPRDVLMMIRRNDPRWKRLVPKPVARLIQRLRVFGYGEQRTTAPPTARSRPPRKTRAGGSRHRARA